MYEDLQAELKSIIKEIKTVPKNTVPYIKLKRRANELHLELIKMDKMIGIFHKETSGNYKVNS